MKSYSDFASEKLQDVRLDIMDIKTPFHIVLFPTWLVMNSPYSFFPFLEDDGDTR